MSVLHLRKFFGSPSYRLLQDGFTLLELLIAIAVASILLAVATPSFTTILQGQSLAADTRAFVGALAFTRSEAALRGRRIAICPSADGNACSNGGNWETGWIIFPDDNGNFVREAGEPLLRIGGLSPGFTLRSTAALRNGLAYRPNGTNVNSGAGGFGAGNFTLCAPQSATQPFRIVIASTGRVRTQRITVPCP